MLQIVVVNSFANLYSSAISGEYNRTSNKQSVRCTLLPLVVT